MKTIWNRTAVAWAAAGLLGLGGCGGGSDPAAPPASQAEKPAAGPDLKLRVPTLAYDDTSVTLVWEKPASYADITDYVVYMDGQRLGSAADNNTLHSPAKPYIDQFYQDDTAGFHTRVTFHNFRVTGLQPDTRYSFTVRSVDRDGKESGDSLTLAHRTAPAFTRVFDVAALGARGDGSTLNTAVIQKAIDDCAAPSTSAYGCKVLVPADSASGKVFVTGALFLRSNMTLEIAEGATLKGSADSADYPLSKGYQLYSFRTNETDDRRPPSLLNALNPAHLNGGVDERRGYDETRGAFTNIRVVGKGTLDGNGWLRGTDTADELGRGLAFHEAGSATRWSTLGVLARSQMEAARTEAGGTLTTTQNANYYSNRRSSLTTFRGVRNIYFGELKLLNPAYHGVMFLESENMVFAYTTTQTFDINNADGVEFGNSDSALVFANFIDSGDDNINFAAGQGRNYQDVPPQQNTWVFNNYLREGHGGLALGSHTGSWIQDILAEDNVMYLTDNGLRMKSTPPTGGGARRVVFRDNAMRDIGTTNTSTAGGRQIRNGGGGGNAFIFTLSYTAGSNVFENASRAAQFRDVTVKNVTVDNVSPATGRPVIQVDAYNGSDASFVFGESFHENLVFDTVKIANARPTSIDRLKNGSFRNVAFTNWGSAASPWVLTNSPGTTFTGVTPMPAP